MLEKTLGEQLVQGWVETGQGWEALGLLVKVPGLFEVEQVLVYSSLESERLLESVFLLMIYRFLWSGFRSHRSLSYRR